ncbi:hypothetical protein CXG81DRAFT_17776 [Caulochytrium protostelioides]|uniref:Uncharacterized protein n=1 Tax=Caulochytrium protostelioides TaxID=1555241 RepID=A0A4P9XB36_9FUNG|nr:hypothetical protein CXG81DRAFT_17776 [Caulochytrium protostelioides]|eukprot:RKP02565.1 hypothetical protein CXG81DRAFT_17776 [Caulochytrium protostelioides]
MRLATWRHGALLAVLALLGPRSGPLIGAYGEVASDARAASKELHASMLHDTRGLDRGEAQPLMQPMATSPGSHHGGDTTTITHADPGAIAARHQPQLHAVHEQLAKGVRQSQSLQQAVLRLQTETNPRTGQAYWTGAQADAYVAAIDSSVSQHLCQIIGTHAEHMAAAGVNPVALLNAEVREAYSQQATVHLSHAASEHLATALQKDPAFANDAAAQALLGIGTVASTAAGTSPLTASGISLSRQLHLAVATAMIASLHAHVPFTMTQFTEMALTATESPLATSPMSAPVESHGVHLERRHLGIFATQPSLKYEYDLVREPKRLAINRYRDHLMNAYPGQLPSFDKCDKWVEDNLRSVYVELEQYEMDKVTTSRRWVEKLLKTAEIEGMTTELWTPTVDELGAYLYLEERYGSADPESSALQSKINPRLRPSDPLWERIHEDLGHDFSDEIFRVQKQPIPQLLDISSSAKKHLATAQTYKDHIQLPEALSTVTPYAGDEFSFSRGLAPKYYRHWDVLLDNGVKYVQEFPLENLFKWEWIHEFPQKMSIGDLIAKAFANTLVDMVGDPELKGSLTSELQTYIQSLTIDDLRNDLASYLLRGPEHKGILFEKIRLEMADALQSKCQVLHGVIRQCADDIAEIDALASAEALNIAKVSSAWQRGSRGKVKTFLSGADVKKAVQREKEATFYRARSLTPSDDVISRTTQFVEQEPVVALASETTALKRRQWLVLGLCVVVGVALVLVVGLILGRWHKAPTPPTVEHELRGHRHHRDASVGRSSRLMQRRKLR